MNTLKERVLLLTIYRRKWFLPSPSIPYNLSLLAGVLKRNGIETKIIDTLAERMDSKEILKEIVSFEPNIVGFTSMTYQICETAKIAESIKKWKKEIITVIGGVHVSALPILTLEEFPFFDIAVINEGVDTIIEIVKASPKDWQKIKGIAFRDSSGIHLTEDREFKKNIDDLPFPAYELLKLNKYKSYWTRRRMEFPMFSGFGCPYRCAFCSRPQGNIVRYFSIERLMEEINRNIKEFNMSSIYFWDDTFTLNRKRVLSICEEFLRRGFNKKVKWKCLSRVDTIDLEMLRYIKEAGCEHIEFGIESGNHQILENIKKPLDMEKAEQVFQWCKEVGIRARAFFIIGFPEENRETLKETYNLIWRLNPDFLTVSILVPFPGTELFKKYVDINTHSKHKWEEYYVEGNPPLLCKNLTFNELKKFQISTYLKFYLRPSHIFSFFMKPTGIIQTIKKAWQDIFSVYFKKQNER